MTKRRFESMVRYWDADDPTKTEADVTFRFYGWVYFRFETWELEWPHGGVSKFWGVKLWKFRILGEHHFYG